MPSITANKDFDLVEELHKLTIRSLTTTFGLDFMLFNDKKGGDVDTVHNVRNNVWATEEEKNRYQERGEYDSSKYHSHPNYRKKGKEDKQKQKDGQLKDAYTGKTITLAETRNLDHTISAKEVHDDPGRVLAEIDGAEIANDWSNLNTTYEKINKSKGIDSVEKFVNEKLPKKIKTLEESISNNTKKLNSMPSSTLQEKHAKKKLENTIKMKKKDLETFKEVEKDKRKIIAKDRHARKVYNANINRKYYTSTKFLKNTGYFAAKSGALMGLREALGIILAEIWFELKEKIPETINKIKSNFELKDFISDIRETFNEILERVKNRFKDLVNSFQDGLLAGILSSLTTTIMNIFVTSQKMMAKILRESWNNLIKAVKTLFFNPDNLDSGSLYREVLRILAFALSSLLGVALNQHLNTILTFPLGSELAAFVSAMFTGIMTLGFCYFLDHNSTIQKIWSFLDGLKSKYKHCLDYFNEINQEMDRYLMEFSRLEFNIDVEGLESLACSLQNTNSEIERSILLRQETQRQGIQLPFEPGNSASTRTWLNNCK